MTKETKQLTIFTLSIFMTFAFSDMCVAAPSYGTKLPPKNKFQIGGQTHTVEKRELDHEHGKMESLQHFVLMSYEIFDLLSLDTKGGQGRIKQDPDSGNKIDYPAFLAGGYGFRIKFFDQNEFKGVFGFQHISVHPHSVSVNGIKHKSVLDNWQFSLRGSYQINKLTPYLGTKWSRMGYIHWVDNTRKRVKSSLSKSVGVISGVNVELNEKFLG